MWNWATGGTMITYNGSVMKYNSKWINENVVNPGEPYITLVNWTGGSSITPPCRRGQWTWERSQWVWRCDSSTDWSDAFYSTYGSGGYFAAIAQIWNAECVVNAKNLFKNQGWISSIHNQSGSLGRSLVDGSYMFAYPLIDCEIYPNGFSLFSSAIYDVSHMFDSSSDSPNPYRITLLNGYQTYSLLTTNGFSPRYYEGCFRDTLDTAGTMNGIPDSWK